MGLSKFSLRRLITATVLAVSLVAGVTPTSVVAQERLQPSGTPAAPANVTEPVVVLTLGSMNKLMQDINYLSSAVGQPQAGGMFAMMAGTFAQGIDMNTPIGVFVPMVDGVPEPIAMVPTANVRMVLKRLEAQTGPVDELEDGTLVIAIGSSTVYVRQSGNWAILARSRALLDAAPADPATLFVGMGNDYDIAIRLKMQLVPPQTRDMLTGQLRQGFEQAMRNQNGGDVDANREMAEATIKQLEQFIQETDELKFGWNIDQQAKNTTMDFSFTAVPGTQLAEMYGGQHAIPSRFASVIREDAAAFYHAATSISPALVEQSRASLQTSISAIKNAIAGEDRLSPEQAADISDMIDRISNLAVDSVAEGKADTGALLLADANKMQLVFGAFVSDGNEAAQIVKDVAKKLEGAGDAPEFKFDMGTYKDVTMHAVEFAIPEKADEARKVFGEKAVLRIGTAPKAVYLAFGNESDDLLKTFIDAGESDNGGGRPVGQLRVHLLPILTYAQSIKADDTLSAMIDTLSRSPDPGLMQVVSDSVPNGQNSRMTIGEGLIKAIGTAVAQAQMKQMQRNGQ